MMIQELTEFPEVREVKRLAGSEDQAEHSVAIQGQQSYRDAGMLVKSGSVQFPEHILDLIEEADGWKQTKITYRTGGEYEGCFTIRIRQVIQ